MKHIKNIFGIVYFIITALLFIERADCQSTLNSLEDNLARQDSLILMHKQDRANRQAKLDDIKIKIVSLKEQKSLNIIQRRRLEGFMREYHSLSSGADSLDREIALISEERNDTLQLLWQEYQKEVNKHVNELSQNIHSLTEEKQKQHISAISSLREKQRQVSDQLLEVRPVVVITPEIVVEPDDDYRRIKEKADLLKDNE